MGTSCVIKSNNRSVRILVAMVVLLSIALFSVSAGNEYSGYAKLIATTAVEAKLEARFGVKLPMLQGDGPLMSSNNLKLNATLGVSPVAAGIALDAILTPIAVVELNIGGGLGVGWSLSDSLVGMRKLDGATFVPDSLKGIVYSGRAGAAVQFDTGAIFEGDWSSVLLRSYHEINYQGYSNAPGDELYEYEMSGLRNSGFSYKGEYFLGYKMPIVLDTAGILIEAVKADIYGDNTSDMFYTVSAVANFGFTEKLDVTIIPQLTTRKINTDRTDSTIPLSFSRVALFINYAL